MIVLYIAQNIDTTFLFFIKRCFFSKYFIFYIYLSFTVTRQQLNDEIKKYTENTKSTVSERDLLTTRQL